MSKQPMTVDVILTKLRAGKDPETGQPHITESEAKAQLHQLILDEVIERDEKHSKSIGDILPRNVRNHLRAKQRHSLDKLFKLGGK